MENAAIYALRSGVKWLNRTGTFFAFSPPHVGNLYKDSRDVTGNATDYFGSSSALELVAFYGETENILYTTQFAGRIYKMTGVKNLGWRRRAGQPAAGTRLGDGTNVTQPPDYFFPVYAGGSTYGSDTAGGGPVIGDAVLADPNDPNSPYVGTAITSVELFNADPNNPLDPIVTNRHYMGLAVDAGGRVYAVSERILEDGVEVAPSYRLDTWNPPPGDGADVSNSADPNNYGPYQIVDPNNAPFDPNNVGGQVILLGGTGVNIVPVFVIQDVSPDGTTARLDQDPGDSQGTADVTYRVYPPGMHPRGCHLKAVGDNADVSGNVLTDPSADFLAAGVVGGDTLYVHWLQNAPWNSDVYLIQNVTDTTVTVDRDMGTSGGAGGVPYGVLNILPGIWTSEAIVDVYLPDGTLDSTIDLNDLIMSDGTRMGDALRFGQEQIAGFVAHGDIEIDPALTVDQAATRLWIAGAGGRDTYGTPQNHPDLLAIDVFIDGTGGGTSRRVRRCDRLRLLGHRGLLL